MSPRRDSLARERIDEAWDMAAHDIFKMPFAKVYSIHVQKPERKGWARDEVDEVILWLTGCSQDSLEQPVMREVGMTTFFAQAPVIVRRRRHVGKACEGHNSRRMGRAKQNPSSRSRVRPQP